MTQPVFRSLPARAPEGILYGYTDDGSPIALTPDPDPESACEVCREGGRPLWALDEAGAPCTGASLCWQCLRQGDDIFLVGEGEPPRWFWHTTVQSPSD